ncbi:MAG: type II secretion system protein N [Henriciella sp.]|nr:type II secretion system protein N [Henriciella sp.]
MRRLLLLVLFVVMLLGSVIAFTPLGFILSQSGAGGLGIGWAKADGTLLKGRISGLYAGTQPIGDVALELRPMSLLSLRPSYDVQWGGAGGQGTAVLTLSRSALTAQDIRMRQEIGALEGLDPAVRAMGGSLDVNDGAFRLTQTGCETASGQLSTNTLSTLAAQYGRQFGEIAGPISCENGAFVLSMEGESNSNDRVSINARATLVGQGEFTTRVQTQDAQIIIALTQIGFARENGAFVYRQSRAGGLQR